MANENNIFQQLIKPVTPKVLAEERVYVYVPQANTKTKGIASFDDSQFQLDNGHVKIKLNDPTTTPSLVQVDKDDFQYTEGIVKINWPYAYNKSGSARTNGYGLVKIADNSKDYLKYTSDGLLAVDITKLDNRYASDLDLVNKLDKRFVTEKSITGVDYESDENGYGSFGITSSDKNEDPNSISHISVGLDKDGSSYVVIATFDTEINQVYMNKGKIDIQSSDGVYLNGTKIKLDDYVNITTDQSINGVKNFIGKLQFNGKDVVPSEHQTTFTDGTIVTTTIDNTNTLGAVHIVTDSSKDGEYMATHSIMVMPGGTLFSSLNNKTSEEKNVYIGINGTGNYNKDGTIDEFATQKYVDNKILDITAIRIRNVDGNPINATVDTVQTVATNYIVTKLGRQPETYDGLFITLTDKDNDVVEYAYFGTTWVNVGINGADLSNYVNLSEKQTITGDKNFTGNLQHNGLDVATTHEAQKMIILGADGVEETQAYSFEVKDAQSYLPYRSNGTKFLVDLHLPVAGDLTKTKKVAITFGDTTYFVYNILKGGEAITIGDLHQVDKYTNATGYRFISEMIFFQTTDLTGFYIIPTVSMSDVLALDSEQMDNYMADGGLTQGQLAICSKVINNGYTAGALYRFDITYPTTYTWTELAGTSGGLTVLTDSDFPLNADLLAKLKANPQNYCYLKGNYIYLYDNKDWTAGGKIQLYQYTRFNFQRAENGWGQAYISIREDTGAKWNDTGAYNNTIIKLDKNTIKYLNGASTVIGVKAETNAQTLTGDDLYLANTIDIGDEA